MRINFGHLVISSSELFRLLLAVFHEILEFAKGLAAPDFLPLCGPQNPVWLDSKLSNLFPGAVQEG